MPMLQTSGTHSCAMISIGDFKTGDQYKINEAYLKDKETGKLAGEDTYIISNLGMNVQEFIDRVLYPTEQELGRTNVYCFDHLMDLIEDTDLNGKYTIATLTGFQKSFENGYWDKRLTERGFTQIDQTYNNWGDVCYVYVKNLGRDGNVYGINHEEDGINHKEEGEDY